MNTGLTEDRVLQLIDAMQSDCCTLRQAAMVLCKPYPTVSRYRKQGHIRAIKKGGQWIVTKLELRRFHVEGNYDPNSPTLFGEAHAITERRLSIRQDGDGNLDLSELTTEERDQLGSAHPIKQIDEEV